MSQIESRWSQVANLRIHFVEAGAGETTILLLHGGGFDSSGLSWRQAVEPLATKRRVLALDFPGFGLSDKPRIEYDLGLYTTFLKRFLDGQSLEKVVLCGLSFGGMVSTSFTLRFPGAVSALVLVDAAGLDRAIRWRLTAWLGSRIPHLHWLLSRVAASNRVLMRVLLRNLVHRSDRLTNEIIEEIRQAIRQPNAGFAWESFLRNETSWRGFRNSFQDRLGEIQVPTLLIHGAEDRIVPVGQSLSAHRRVKTSQLEVFEDCGHWAPREDPQEFSRVLLRFLEERRL